MKTLTFTFTSEMAAVIGNILSEHPYKIVAPILTEMQRQIDQQDSRVEQRPNGGGLINIPSPPNEADRRKSKD